MEAKGGLEDTDCQLRDPYSTSSLFGADMLRVSAALSLALRTGLIFS